MSDKKAFVFDTNFIVQNKKLTDVIDKLKDSYNLYVTQLSIDERIAQQVRERNVVYDEAEKLQQENLNLLSVHFKKSKDEIKEYVKTGVQRIYSEAFGDTIIEYSTTADSFKRVIQRANDKLPPFSNDKNASDKGFKDCLLWFSILDYFRCHGENEVLFITNDQGFLKNKEYLIAEFKKETGKIIEIESNTFYNELIESREIVETKPDETKEITIPNVEAIRDRINTLVEDIRIVEYNNHFGDECWERTFSTSKLLDKDYVQLVFEGLDSAIKKHFLESSIKATEVLEYDNRIENGNIEIPIKALEELKKLYDEIKTRYPKYLDPLFEATAKILNSNYIEPKQLAWEDDLPF